MLLTLVATVIVFSLLLRIFHAAQPLTIKGAIIVSSDDVNKRAPIPGVWISVEGDSENQHAFSSPTGFFELNLGKRVKSDQLLILQFRHPQYLPTDVTTLATDGLFVARLAPIAEFGATAPSVAPTVVSNIKVRYTVKTTTMLNVGSTLKIFHVVNVGSVPCAGHYPCSPDEKWQATVGSATLRGSQRQCFLRRQSFLHRRSLSLYQDSI